MSTHTHADGRSTYLAGTHGNADPDHLTRAPMPTAADLATYTAGVLASRAEYRDPRNCHPPGGALAKGTCGECRGGAA